MKPEDQRIAIAEACGWNHFGCTGCLSVPCKCNQWIHADHGPCGLPDYLSDLNAMHEAEKTLTGPAMEAFVWELERAHPTASIGSCQEYGDVRDEVFDLVHASASMRAEAFLKTTGLWKGSPPLNAGETLAP